MALIENEFVELQLGSTASPPVYTALGQLLSVKPPGIAVTDVKTTKRGDTAQKFRPGLIPDFGEVSFRLQYDPALHDDLTDLMAAPATRSWKVIHKSSTGTTLATAAFQGHLKAWEPDEGEEESDYVVAGTIKVSGAVTWS